MRLQNSIYIVVAVLAVLVAIWFYKQSKIPAPVDTSDIPVQDKSSTDKSAQPMESTQTVTEKTPAEKDATEKAPAPTKPDIDTIAPSETTDLKLESRQHIPTKIKGLIVYTVPTHQDLQSVFNKHNYTLQDWAGVAPAIAPDFMPQNLDDMSVTNRKNTFIQMMIPLIVHANSTIVKQRNIVHTLSEQFRKNGQLTAPEQQQLAPIIKAYHVKGNFETDTADILNTLHHRVQPIPVALALSQAIIESGWGTSRFAVQGNSLFGQWTYAKGAGLTPENRDANKTHTVRAFNSPYDSVVAYMLNLNRNPAYSTYRKIRYDALQQNRPITGHILAEGLKNYSQLGYEYVKKVQKIIYSNKLEMYNNTTLEEL